LTPGITREAGQPMGQPTGKLMIGALVSAIGNV